jgi:hypothetical protein
MDGWKDGWEGFISVSKLTSLVDFVLRDESVCFIVSK